MTTEMMIEITTTRARLARGATAGAAVVLAALAACSDPEPAVIQHGPSVTVNPAALSLVVGQASGISVGFPGGGAAGTRVRWTSNAPDVAAVDSTPRVGTAAGEPVTVRAVAVGATALTVVITHMDQTITGSVPVTVRAAP